MLLLAILAALLHTLKGAAVKLVDSHIAQCVQRFSHLDINVGEDDLIYILEAGFEDCDLWKTSFAEKTVRAMGCSHNDDTVIAHQLERY